MVIRNYELLQQAALNHTLAEQLTKQAFYSIAISASISFCTLLILLRLILNRAFAPIKKITNEVSLHGPNGLSNIDQSAIPHEIKPLMTELSHLFDRLSEAMQREKRFAADAAHELRTPLAVLGTQTQAALRATTEQERETALLNIVNGVKRSGHVVHQLLTLSRMVPQAVIQEPEQFDLAGPATEMISDLVPQGLTKNIEIELDAPEKAMISGNPIALCILLRNLIDNALRYSPEDGVVIVSTRNLPQEQKVALIVRDTGPGIAEELREQVFDRFFRIDGKVSGSGLGLSIVKQIVKLHRGHIELRTPCDPPGDAKANRGLEIYISFPEIIQIQ